MTRMKVAGMLKEALQMFCEPLNGLRPALAEPFRQNGYVCASDGHILIRVSSHEAGCAVGPFRKMDDFDVQRPVPGIGFEHLLGARTLRRKDLQDVTRKMERHEREKGTPAMAEICGVQIDTKGVSRIGQAMLVFGAEKARLVWHEDDKLVLQLLNDKGQEAVTILQMGWVAGNRRIFKVPTTEGYKDRDVRVDWHRGAANWAELKALQERLEEEERMARREVFMVEVVKRAHIPVYAKDPNEARLLADKYFFDPEDEWESEWEIGDTVPEAEDAESASDDYKDCITRDGVVGFDEIFGMEQVSEEWHRKGNNIKT